MLFLQRLRVTYKPENDAVVSKALFDTDGVFAIHQGNSNGEIFVDISDRFKPENLRPVVKDIKDIKDVLTVTSLVGPVEEKNFPEY